MLYTVKPGDHLHRIARRHGLSLVELLNLNPSFRDHPDMIRVGDRLRVAPEPEPASDAGSSVSNSHRKVLGFLSEKYETGGKGAGTVSSGIGDRGGVSYGSYQMTSKPHGGTVSRFIKNDGFEFAPLFSGLLPGSPAFSAQWRKLAVDEPKAFQTAQHQYIKATHYDRLAAKIARDQGFDVNTHSWALQNTVWSTAVQHGGNTNVVNRALNRFMDDALVPGDGEFDAHLIGAIYQERGRKNHLGNLVYFHRNSAAVQAGVSRRFVNERQDALAMLAEEPLT